ncbi:hypothetical protein [Methylobacterium sp. E-005]|nr:hypothetical protein [Methylobacterium sp. E-005]
MPAHLMAIAWRDRLNAAKKQHAAEDEAERWTSRANTHPGTQGA